MITDRQGNLLTRRELLRRIGRLEQVAGIEPFVFDDGPSRGVRAFRFRTGSGLSFDVLPDRGMDLGLAEHRGTPLAWLSPNGIVAPAFHEVGGEGWLNSFPGGLLVTCGLRNVGPPGERGGEEFGLHGRASHIPATGVSYDAFWDEEGCVLVASGQIRESSVFGPNLVLRRRIMARVGESRIRIEDQIENGQRPDQKDGGRGHDRPPNRAPNTAPNNRDATTICCAVSESPKSSWMNSSAPEMMPVS